MNAAGRSPLVPLLAGIGLWGLLALPPARAALEGSLIGHVLVQMPLLAASGWLAARPFRGRPSNVLSELNRYGIPGILLALATAAFWMLPRWLDAALTDPTVEAAKFASLPLLLGVPVALGWSRLPFAAKGFVAVNALSMAAVLAWLYQTAPARLCTSYLASDQERLGEALLWVVLGLTLWLAVRGVAFASPRRSDGEAETGVSAGTG